MEAEPKAPSPYDPVRVPSHVDSVADGQPGHDGLKCRGCRKAFSVGTSGYCEKCRRKAVLPKGTRRKGDALSEDEVRQIKRMWSQFKSADEIARHFKVCTTTVYNVLKGR